MRRTLTAIFLFISLRAAADDPVFKNSFYAFYFNAVQHSFHIESTSGEQIISSSSLYQLEIRTDSHDTIHVKSIPVSFNVKKTGRLTEVTWKDSNALFLTSFNLVLDPSSEEIKINSTYTYAKEVEVIREAMILTLARPLAEVYRRNTLLDTTGFQNEYWLNKEGLKSGGGSNTFLIYHTPEVSSLQLNPEKNQVIINLDYNKDHPFQHFPLRDSRLDEKQDLSCSIYKDGDARKNSFSIHVGRPIEFVPRIMLNPNGYLSGHIFTEHADWTDLPTHLAVYFGSEEIKDAKSATGGFIKNKIPVTKSVFYANPDSVLNSHSTHKSIFTTPIASIEGTPGYLDFLRQLGRAGDEICLHTPDQYTSKRPLIEEACAFMKKNFNSVTWIDHGYNNSPKNNREAFVCDGLNTASSSFAADIWKKCGLKYFWNSYYDDFVTEDSAFFDFNGSIMHPYPGFGDAAPSPLYWKSPTRTDNFYSWPTRDLLEMHDPEAWNFHFSTERLNDFVQQRTVKFEHCYPAGSTPGNGYWKFNSDNKIVIEPQFEKALEQLASFRDSGLINLCTVRELLDYWVACEKISFEYPGINTVKIINGNSTAVKGVSFAVSAKKIITEKYITQKFDGNDLVFWFDMKPGETVELQFSN